LSRCKLAVDFISNVPWLKEGSGRERLVVILVIIYRGNAEAVPSRADWADQRLDMWIKVGLLTSLLALGEIRVEALT
jgi:hypothetical protein